jgi:hypothetical protein
LQFDVTSDAQPCESNSVRRRTPRPSAADAASRMENLRQELAAVAMLHEERADHSVTSQHIEIAETPKKLGFLERIFRS